MASKANGGLDGDARFVKYFACNVARLGAGRGIGTDLAVWTGVAPAFPPASGLSTPSPALALPSRRPSGLFVRSLQLTLHGPPATPAALRLPDDGSLRNPSAPSPAGANRKTSIFMPDIQKPKSHPACACSPHTGLIDARFLRKCDTVNTRAEFPNASLADLYDPDTMPPALVRAHHKLDAAVDAAYGKKSLRNDAERVGFLFELYRKYTSLLPADGTPTAKRKAAKKRPA